MILIPSQTGQHSKTKYSLAIRRSQRSYQAYLFSAVACRALRKLAVPALLAASLNANADCNLTVQFTRADGQPLFTEVTSVIYRMGAFIAADDRHSYTVKLPCPAIYQIAATSSAQQRARAINLRADSKITIEMGN